jgi:TonB family protein
MKKILSKIIITISAVGCAFFVSAVQAKSFNTTNQFQALVSMNEVVPKYPAQAITKKTEGFVTLAFEVNGEGEAVNIEVVDFEGSKYFIRSSVKALEQTQFKAKMGQQPIGKVQKTYEFYMDENNLRGGSMVAANRNI